MVRVTVSHRCQLSLGLELESTRECCATRLSCGCNWVDVVYLYRFLFLIIGLVLLEY
ncbi:hypothetical protein T440DRAFT_70621 [Plenodomus tracheiphilus IPT5]|uniref:Uncharacterized protein n=1 Tax=Plenodomus tracheiphilus IPT5 TaxID=1408161 RepID=A0A6A7BAG1_9PLEO|nr:hypothetical protein T440DRAFT_70621 [Plenodomus tracheiphilus IPT5]